MSYLKLDVTKTKGFYDEKLYLDLEKEIYKSYDTLRNKNGLGNDYLGWLDLPLDYDKDELRKLQLNIKKVKTK